MRDGVGRLDAVGDGPAFNGRSNIDGADPRDRRPDGQRANATRDGATATPVSSLASLAEYFYGWRSKLDEGLGGSDLSHMMSC